VGVRKTLEGCLVSCRTWPVPWPVLRRLLIDVLWLLIDVLRISSPRTIMSTVPSTSTSQSNFVSIFNAALESYKHNTKNDLASHPLLPSLQSCDSPGAILTVLREQIPAFSQSKNGDDELTKWVTQTVNVLYSFSAALGGAFGVVNVRFFPREESALILAFQVYPPANIIFAGIGVLLLVGVPCNFLVQSIYTVVPRRLKMPAQATTSSSKFLTALNTFSGGSRFTLASHRLRL
jgi:hypothetical protein